MRFAGSNPLRVFAPFVPFVIFVIFVTFVLGGAQAFAQT
jgi:hypothetical protein